MSFCEPQGKECRVCTPPLRGSDGNVYGAIILAALGDEALVGG